MDMCMPAHHAGWGGPGCKTAPAAVEGVLLLAQAAAAVEVKADLIPSVVL